MTETAPAVLIVEDEPMLLDIASEEFAEAGYAVTAVLDGDAALAALTGDTRCDLLFTDIRIPGEIDGWELAARARDLRPGLAVIYATGFTGENPGLVEDAKFFRKPYRLTAIIDAARELGVRA